MAESPRRHTIQDTPTEQWLPRIYAELRQLAKMRMAKEPVGQTLEPTALVHEVYLRLTAQEQQWDSPGHFFASAAIAMQRILIDNARRKQSAKHGGDVQRVDLDEHALSSPADDLQSLIEALNALANEDAVAAQIVDLHHFGGLRQTAVAEQLGITEYQVRQKWTYARAMLKAELRNDAD